MFVTKKYLMFMWWVCLLLDACPFISNKFALVLSWWSLDGLRGYPCASRKYQVHMIAGIWLYITTTSASVELVVLIFCVLSDLSIIRLSNIMYAPV